MVVKKSVNSSSAALWAGMVVDNIFACIACNVYFVCDGCFEYSYCVCLFSCIGFSFSSAKLVRS